MNKIFKIAAAALTLGFLSTTSYARKHFMAVKAW